MKLIELVVKVSLSILFLLCLLKMPYGYYQIVRFAGMIGFVLSAYLSFQKGRNVEVIIYIALALLFQPFVKIALGRTVWNAVDVVVAAGLIGSLFVKGRRK